MSNIRTRIGAGFAAAAVIAAPLAGLGVSIATAQTATGDLPVAGHLPDANLTSNLTLHKLVGAGSVQGDGQELPSNPEGTVPLGGVEFSIQKVDVDLTTQDGWKEAATLDATSAADKLIGQAQTGVTSDDGTVTFKDMALGLYLVKETAAPQGVSMSAPFLVYLPMTQANDDGSVSWNRDVHAYPKNSQVSVEKTVADEGDQAGDTVDYTITGTVPQNFNVTPGEDTTVVGGKFEFNDFLDAKNAYVGVDQKIELKIVGGDSDGTTLVAGEDYTVKGNDATAESAGSLAGPEVGPEGNKTPTQHIKVTLTENGLNKIVGADKVVMHMEAVLKPVSGTDGVTFNFVRNVINDGQGGGDVIVSNIPGDDPDDPSDPPTDNPNNPNPGVKTYLGILDLLKQDGNNNDIKLEGAQFQLYSSEVEGLDKVAAVKEQGKLVTVSGEDTWTTNSDGKLVIDGIHASDFADNKVDESPVYYYLVETKAPDGYARLDVVTPFELKQEGFDGTTALTAQAVVDNYKDENKLPFTGGAGMFGLLAAGAGVAGVGIAANRKRKGDNEEEAVAASDEK